jgi:flagellar hook assembly protein FlgD
LLKYAVPATDEVELKIYNIAGELVATLINSVKSKGEYNAYWDGKNLMHEYVSPGVYFVYLKVGDTVKIEKIVVIK